MSRISERFHSNNSVDNVWKLCLFSSALILCITVFIFTRILQSLYCIPRAAHYSEFEPKNIKTYSTVSATFATCNAIVSFSWYIICTQEQCSHNISGISIGVLFWNFYNISKTFLYSIFIARLFNPHYYRIYQYSKYIQYLLRVLLCTYVMVIIIFDIEFGLLLAGIDISDHIDYTNSLVYFISDFLLALFCIFLFFRPICSRDARDTNVSMSAAKRYGLISALQFIASAIYQLSIIIGPICFDALGATVITWQEYNYVVIIIRQLDCILLMICIYFGFSRKRTVCNMFMYVYVYI